MVNRPSVLQRFWRDARANVTIVVGLAAIVLLVAAGAGIDLARAYMARQKLSEVAVLACQYSTRQSVLSLSSTQSFPAYEAAVNTFVKDTLVAQKWSGPTPGGTGFSATATVGPSPAPVDAQVRLTGSVTTSVLNIVGVKSMPVQVAIKCQDASSPWRDREENFDNTACNGGCFTQPNGSTDAPSSPTTKFPSAPSYTGADGLNWYVTGYCLERDSTGTINSTSPNSNHTAELDCENDRHSAGDSSITTKLFYPTGFYEIRYWFRSRVQYPNYDPAYICGSTAADVAWANDNNAVGAPVPGPVVRNNQIGVYFDPVTGAAPPLHWTTDNSVQVAGGNLVDVCVNSARWIQRSVKFNVTTPGEYWLTFAADGANNSYGGQIGDIQICANTCPGKLQDNFPSAWTANPTLFTDSFEFDWVHLGVHNLSYPPGRSGAMTHPGWPGQDAFTDIVPNGSKFTRSAGWIAAPYNDVVFYTSGALSGALSLQLTGVLATPTNRAVSRAFLLDPGYYAVDYGYVSNLTGLDFSTKCAAAPNATLVSSYNTTGFYSGVFWSLLNNTGVPPMPPFSMDATTVGVFVGEGRVVSGPNNNGAAYSPVASPDGWFKNIPTSYTNPEGTITASPSVAPAFTSITSYLLSDAANQGASLLDLCASSAVWTHRTVYFKAPKVGLYWLSFAGLGSTINAGGRIDDIRLSAVGSPYATPPAPLSAIAVATPQPDAIFTNDNAFTGFYVVADPFVPPAADQ